jgi:hypothetical protein
MMIPKNTRQPLGFLFAPHWGQTLALFEICAPQSLQVTSLDISITPFQYNVNKLLRCLNVNTLRCQNQVKFVEKYKRRRKSGKEARRTNKHGMRDER